jgi:hypothetical protein
VGVCYERVPPEQNVIVSKILHTIVSLVEDASLTNSGYRVSDIVKAVASVEWQSEVPNGTAQGTYSYSFSKSE